MTLTITRLGALLRHVTKFITVATLDLLGVGAVTRIVTFLAAVVAGTSASASLGAVLREVAS